VVRDRDELPSRIAANVEAMFAQGVESEVEGLPEKRVGTTASMTLGLREIRSLLRGEISRATAMESITTSTRRYAKRQMTWFRNQHEFPELNMSHFPDPDEALREALRLMELTELYGSGL
jgi:tRNA dimethylallyltransferase